MEYSELPNNNIKKIVARRLLESKQSVPHFYLTVDCRIDGLLAARAKLNNSAKGAYKLSVNDFVIKAVAMALQKYPAANVSWTDDAVLQYVHSDVSVAVATPNGLITPIIKHAETKGLADISKEMKDLAGRARDGKLKPEEFQGGTFSVSNLGMFGVKDFQASSRQATAARDHQDAQRHVPPRLRQPWSRHAPRQHRHLLPPLRPKHPYQGSATVCANRSIGSCSGDRSIPLASPPAISTM